MDAIDPQDMKLSTRATVCFRNFASLMHAFAGVIQCVFAILLKGSHVDGFEFGLNVMLGVMNIPLGCVMTTVLRKRCEPGEPGQYVALNRLGVALFLHSVVFNASCASVVYMYPSDLAPTPGTTSTRFHQRWLVALDYMAVASLALPLVLVFLATSCLLSLTRSPLNDVIPKQDSHLDDYIQFARVDNVELQPYTWVFDGSARSRQRGEPGTARNPRLLSRGSDLPFPPPRFTFCRGQSVDGSGGNGERSAVAGPSRRRDDRSRSAGGTTRTGRLGTRLSAREGCCRSLSSGDDDFEAFDSLASDCFDEVPLGSVEAAAPAALCAVGNTEQYPSSSGVHSRSFQGRDRAKPALQRLASMDLGVDSLGNLTNLELLARQWRTSAMLRKIWRQSERRARSSRE